MAAYSQTASPSIRLAPCHVRELNLRCSWSSQNPYGSLNPRRRVGKPACRWHSSIRDKSTSERSTSSAVAGAAKPSSGCSQQVSIPVQWRPKAAGCDRAGPGCVAVCHDPGRAVRFRLTRPPRLSSEHAPESCGHRKCRDAPHFS